MAPCFVDFPSAPWMFVYQNPSMTQSLQRWRTFCGCVCEARKSGKVMPEGSVFHRLHISSVWSNPVWYDGPWRHESMPEGARRVKTPSFIGEAVDQTTSNPNCVVRILGKHKLYKLHVRFPAGHGCTKHITSQAIYVAAAFLTP